MPHYGALGTDSAGGKGPRGGAAHYAADQEALPRTTQRRATRVKTELDVWPVYSSGTPMPLEPVRQWQVKSKGLTNCDLIGCRMQTVRSGVALCRLCDVFESLILVISGYPGQAFSRSRGSPGTPAAASRPRHRKPPSGGDQEMPTEVTGEVQQCCFSRHSGLFGTSSQHHGFGRCLDLFQRMTRRAKIVACPQ